MGSYSINKPGRLTLADYNILKQSLNKQEFYEFYLNNGNDFVCKKFNLSLNVMYRLVKDLNIQLTDDQKKFRNKVAAEQKCFEKFHVNNNFQRKEVQEQIKKNNLKKYGVENIFSDEKIKEKIRQTNLNKYGVGHVSQSPCIQEKAKDTCLKKYGVDNYAKTTTCKEKIKNTNLRKYGTEVYNCFGTDEYKQCLINIYGTENISNLDSVKEKSKQTSLKKYGVTHYSKTSAFHQRINKKYICDNISFDSLPELAVYVYCKDSKIDIKRPDTSFIYTFNGEEHSYFPDFEISGKLVEIKGDHFFKPDGTMCNPFDHSQDDFYEAKHKCGLANGVEFWRSSDYKKFLDYFTSNYNIEVYDVYKRKVKK